MAVALAETSDVAAMLQRSLTGPEEIATAKALNYASGAIRRYTRQTLTLVTDDTVTLRGGYGRKLVLPERPVVEVSALAVAGRPVAAGMYSVVNDELWNGPALSQVGNAAEYDGGGWGSPAVIVAVTYTHGFVEVPEEIVGLCVEMVKRYAVDPTGGGAVASETIGSYSYTTGNSGGPTSAYVLTEDDKEVLRPYRRTWFQ